MNERIKELADEAAKFSAVMALPTGESGDRLFVERFAESIIKECIEQIQLSTARDPRDTPQYKQSVGHIHRIRQHFGIEV